jgi:CRISPR system Cascade subunit CasB
VRSRGAIALSWWSILQPDHEGGRKGDTGALARLRRATPLDAMTEEVTVHLHRRFESNRDAFARTAMIACVLAHVREHDPLWRVARAAGRLAGQAPGEVKYRLSPLRFRRLLTIRGEDDCVIAFRRLVAVLDDRVNVADLAQSLYEWNDEEKGDRCRTRWAFDYYDAASAAPETSVEPA